MKWPLEAPGIYCAGGKVFLNEIADSPEPLNSLINNINDRPKVYNISL